MHINELDLNLLRLFDAIYTTGNVSRAAERLALTQPAASQGLARLRTALSDPLFERVSTGVRPTPHAQRLAPTIRSAMAMLEHVLQESGSFTPATARRRFKLHMSDVGVGRFLPRIASRVRQLAPNVDLECQYLPVAELSTALDIGRIDLAFGHLPLLKDTQRQLLMRDRYVLLLRSDHPFTRLAKPAARQAALAQLDFVAVSTHADTLNILRNLDVEYRIRLRIEHFYVLPEIVRATDLASIVPLEIASRFSPRDFAVIDVNLPKAQFDVFLHWNRRFENEAGNQWLRETITSIFSAEA